MKNTYIRINKLLDRSITELKKGNQNLSIKLKQEAEQLMQKYNRLKRGKHD